MYCEKCGKNLDAEARFCSFCGSPVEKRKALEHTASDFEMTEEMEAAYKQWSSQQKDYFDEEWEREERREKLTFMIFGVVIVMLLVAITSGVVWMIQRENEKLFEDINNIIDSGAEEFMPPEKSDVFEIVVTPEVIKPNESLKDSDSERNMDEDFKQQMGWEESEYVIYDSNTRYLVSADLKNLTAWEIRVARNEIFARHGRMFDAMELKEYFESKSWYKPTIPAAEFSNSCLNSIELENLNFIISYEKAHNLK